MKPRSMTVPFPGVLALCNIAQLFGIGCRKSEHLRYVLTQSPLVLAW